MPFSVCTARYVPRGSHPKRTSLHPHPASPDFPTCKLPVLRSLEYLTFIRKHSILQTLLTLASKPATTLFTARRPGLRTVAGRPRPCACSGSGVQTSRSPSASVYGSASLLQGQKRLAWSVDVVKLSSSFCSISNSSDVSPAVWKNGSAPLLFWISLVSSVCGCVNFLALEDGNDLLLVLL
jgi:hypothetical protein